MRRRRDGQGVARGEQGLQREHEGREGAVGNEHLIRPRPVLGGEHLAQRRVAVARAVGEDAHVIGREGGPRAFGDQIAVESLRTRSAPREGDRRHGRGLYRTGSLPGRGAGCYFALAFALARAFARAFFLAAARAALASFALLAMQKLLMPSGLLVKRFPV